MPEAQFEPVFLRRQHFVAEITNLDEIFDFLEEWPQDKRGLAYDTLLKACRDTASGRFPLNAARENFRRFLKMSGVLAKAEGAAKFELMNDRTIGTA